MTAANDNVPESLCGGRAALYCGDCIDALATMPAASADSVVTDPPYHLTSTNRGSTPGSVAASKDVFKRVKAGGFMGKSWDGGDIAFRPETWAAVARVIKPGAHLAAFGGTRTFHRMMVAIEDAGLELRDTVMWVYGQGFPKSHNQHGAWEGWGTALKPAWEPIAIFRKPLIGTVAKNLEEHGTGAINVDACRVECSSRLARSTERSASGLAGAGGAVAYGQFAVRGSIAVGETTQGRWPANVVHDGSDDVVELFPQSAGQLADARGAPKIGNVYGKFNHRNGESSSERRYADNGSTSFAAMPGARRGDSGSAARFFYCGKATKAERAGSKHPTVKPIALLRWIVRLITPPGGLVLDPFAGTATTGEAALMEGMRAILIEREPEYQTDIRNRMGAVA